MTKEKWHSQQLWPAPVITAPGRQKADTGASLSYLAEGQPGLCVTLFQKKKKEERKHPRFGFVLF